MLAIDDNENMLDYAARKAAKAGVEVQFLEQDMEEFKLPVCIAPFFLADGKCKNPNTCMKAALKAQCLSPHNLYGFIEE